MRYQWLLWLSVMTALSVFTMIFRVFSRFFKKKWNFLAKHLHNSKKLSTFASLFKGNTSRERLGATFKHLTREAGRSKSLPIPTAKAFGRLAQLVQSVCLTSRGSAVRIRQRPPTKNQALTVVSVSAFFIHGAPFWKQCVNKLEIYAINLLDFHWASHAIFGLNRTWAKSPLPHCHLLFRVTKCKKVAQNMLKVHYWV